MKFKITKDWVKSFFVMIIAVIVMGMSVSLLVMCDMAATCIGVVSGGEVGVITILMVVTLEPIMDLVGRIIKTRRVVEKQGL